MQKIFGFIIFIGFVLLIGTAGARADNGIDITQAWLQISIAVVMMGFGAVGTIRTDKQNITISEDLYNMMYQSINKSASGTRNTESTKRKNTIKIITSKRSVVNGKF